VRREHKKKLSASDLRAAGVSPQLVRRRIPAKLHPGPNGLENRGQGEGVVPYNTRELEDRSSRGSPSGLRASQREEAKKFDQLADSTDRQGREERGA
jgi:hypothetical protein